MKVKELIEKLQKTNPEALVELEYDAAGGCDCAGSMGMETQSDLGTVFDLETRVVLSTDSVFGSSSATSAQKDEALKRLHEKLANG